MDIEIPVLSQITIYPIKSLDGVSLTKALISEGGCLLHDREFAITDENGVYINGKSNPLVHSLRSRVDFETKTISFRNHAETVWSSFSFVDQKQEIEALLSDHFHCKTILHQNKTGRFLDIPDISGATILSTSSLITISEWYNIDIEETRKRFRATLEIEGVTEFWEDHLFSHKGDTIKFTVGDVTMIGMSPRARCVVPTRDPETGEVTHAFPKIFSRHRYSSLPDWSTLDEYGHHYFLSVDCYIPPSEVGKWIILGDKIELIRENV